jgi:hypothetical protein
MMNSELPLRMKKSVFFKNNIENEMKIKIHKARQRSQRSPTQSSRTSRASRITMHLNMIADIFICLHLDRVFFVFPII